jgi:hypothetical protein
VTVLQDDTVKLTVFVVNGDEHDVRIADPEGRDVVAVAFNAAVSGFGRRGMQKES